MKKNRKVKIKIGPGPDDVVVDEVNFSALSMKERKGIRARGMVASFRPIPAYSVVGKAKNPNMLRIECPDGRVRDMIDCQAMNGATGLGNPNKNTLRFVLRQMEKGTPAVFYTIDHPLVAPMLTALWRFIGDSNVKFVFGTSGGFAVTAAVRIAYQYWNTRHGPQIDGADSGWDTCWLIAANENHHGFVGHGLSLSSSDAARKGFGPLIRQIAHVPFDDAQAIERVFKEKGRGNVAAVILEPVQGAAGIFAPAPGYLKKVEQLCRKYDALLIIDAVKTCFGRTGTKWGYEQDDIKPDLIVAGKMAGAGLIPVAFTFGRPELIDLLQPWTIGHTWVATPHQAMAVISTIKEVEDRGLVSKAKTLGDLFTKLMDQVSHKHPGIITKVDGQGLLRAVESIYPSQEVVEQLHEENVHSVAAYRHPKRVVFNPPLTITAAQVRAVARAYDKAFTRLSN